MVNTELMEKISQAVVNMEEDEAVTLCKRALEEKIPADESINQGLIPGMDKVSKLYEEEEYFLPEVLMCSDAMNAGINVLKPYIDQSAIEDPIKIVIGVIEGDTHDIGKNLVRIMLESAGMKVYDLGRDVPLDQFVQKAEEVDADIIGMSTLMTTTMDGMKTVIEKMRGKGIRGKYKVMIGGGPISKRFADTIGADIYAKDAAEAVRMVKQTFAENVKKGA
jgi:dimethylamine corrinoid protein